MTNHWLIIASIYSGRPDPRWEITERQAEHFMILWHEAPPSAMDVTIPSRSGYKGIRILAGEQQFLIYEELITCIEKKMRTSKKDHQRTIEKFLLNTAPEQIHQVLKQLNVL